MKKLYYILLLPLITLLGACSDDVVDNLSGTYNDIERITFTGEKTLPTDKLKKGLKYLNMEFTAEGDVSLSLRVVSPEWTLQSGSYTPIEDLEAPKAQQFYGFVSHGTQAAGRFTEGTLEVNLVNGIYYISGLFSAKDGKRYVLNFRGPIEFEIGVDDPEASGYTITMKAEPVIITDYTTW